MRKKRKMDCWRNRTNVNLTSDALRGLFRVFFNVFGHSTTYWTYELTKSHTQFRLIRRQFSIKSRFFSGTLISLTIDYDVIPCHTFATKSLTLVSSENIDKKSWQRKNNIKIDFTMHKHRDFWCFKKFLKWNKNCGLLNVQEN